MISDQDVFCKISQIMLKEGDKDKGIINVMDGFHIPLINFKVLYNKLALLGLRGRSKIITDESVKKALDQEEHNYLHFKSLEKSFQANFISKKLMRKTKHVNLPAFCKDETFKPRK